MSLSVKENRLVTVNQLGENTLQIVLQGKVELPSTAAPVGRIVWVKGTPVLQGWAAEQDGVSVQGVIDLVMVYVPETLEGEPAGLERVEWPGALPFDSHVEVIGTEPKMLAEVQAKILVCEWDLRSGQYSLDIDVILAVTARVAETKEYKIISDVNMAKPAKVQTDGVILDPAAPWVEVKVDKELTGIFELGGEGAPRLQSILALTAKAQMTEMQVTTGKMVVKGVTTLNVLYEAEDLAVKTAALAQVLPFEVTLEKPGIEPGMILETRLIPRCEGFVVNDGKSLRVDLRLKGVLLLKARHPIQILTDISAQGSQVAVRKELIMVDSYVHEKEQQGAARGLLEISQKLPPIRELLHTSAVAHVTDYEVDQDKLVVEGVLDVELFYLAHSEEDTKPLFRGFFPEVIPFTQTIAVPGLEPGMQPRIRVEALAVQTDLINRETVEAALTLRYVIGVIEYLEIEAVVEAVEIEPEPEDPPSLTFVFVQNGDTVWKLAKRYYTTEEAILKANPSLQENPALLKTGDRISIPR